MKNFFRVFLWLSLLVPFWGCLDNQSFKKKYTPKKIKPEKIKVINFDDLIESYTLTLSSKRDPFRSPYLSDKTEELNTDNNENLPLPKKREPQTPLEKYELDQLKVVATVTGIANPIAMVEDPEGNGYLVRRGSIIGRNGGRVWRIHSDGIIIEEKIRDKTGAWVIRRVKKKIHKELKDKKSSYGVVIINGKKYNLEELNR